MMSFQSGPPWRPPGPELAVAAAAGTSRVRDPVPGLRRDTGLAAEWGFEEQVILREGLAKFANEPGINKYIKIAAMLREKTVRDVALRCRWMAKKEHGKRRKSEELCAGRKLKDKKEKMVDSYSENIHMLNSDMTSYSLLTHHPNHTDQLSCEATDIYGPMWTLMDANTQVFRQIDANLATLKIKENIDLFRFTSDNISAILNSMSETPGIMSRMSSLPVSMDEQLLNTILPGTNQALTFHPHPSFHLKQEP